MTNLKSTDIRRNWSETLDTVIRDKPVIFNRTRDTVLLSNTNFLKDILNSNKFHAIIFTEDDGSTTLSLEEIDLISNAETLELAKEDLAKQLVDYSSDFYNNYSYWSSAPNRKAHISFVFKVLLAKDVKEVEEYIICQNGQN